MSESREPSASKAASERFSEMSRKITENSDNGFSGAVVVVPPEGDPIDLLMVSPVGDEALFWATLKTQVDLRLADMQQRQNNQNRW